MDHKYTPSSKSSTKTSTTTNSPLEYLCILDFEATCDQSRSFGPCEIIEFPIVLLNVKTLKVEEEFHTYCRPTRIPKLTAFCTELTGIQQETVNNAPVFEEVYQQVDDWLRSKNLVDSQSKRVNFAFVTCGDWDLKTMLPKQTQLSGLHFPKYFKEWINIKHAFGSFFNVRPSGMTGMLSHLGMQLEGRHHSGIDDCRNITRVMIRLLEQGYVPQLTWVEFK
eukprot:TRINITY_DN2034_c0_g1_i1.p1 TRINITY_DN2034_c0_g1~~TRINITY_DN2034_c0_g1_i1.p1  ORF type:complete len:250 (+),score=62.26 TRINITY_DN2034_c0_g1_i1:86-751(+)